MLAAPAAPQQDVVMPMELLERICWPVASGSDQHTHAEAVNELRARLNPSAQGEKP
ncbi:hypothetical protein D3C85_1750800 [compost metagenome]